MQKKVTLSVDNKVYEDFKKYCEENAIMLSKKIEIFMKDLTKKNKTHMIMFLSLFIIMISQASAVMIFYDDFESGSLSGWTLTTQSGANAWTNSNTNPSTGLRHAQDNPQGTAEPASVMERIISTAGYQSITFNYSRKLVGLDSADEFQVEYNTGSGWTILEQTGSNSADDANYINQSFSLPVSANNNSAFQIKFECTAGAVSEFCRVDNVNISGIVIDITPPSFSNFNETPANGSAYLFGQIYRFNATITESNFGKAGIEFNGINYTNRNVTNISSVYTFNISNLASGTYVYYWWANDTNGNYNTSEAKQFTISKASPNITKMLNGVNNNLSVQYPQQVNASGTASAGTLSIYRNGISINNGQNYTLGVGYYRLDFNATGNQNYTNNSESLYLNVTKIQSFSNLTFDKSSPQTYETQITPTCAAVGETTPTLKVNGTVIPSGNPITLGAGTWTFNCSLAQSENYTLSENISLFTISKASGNASLLLNNNVNNLTIAYPQQINASASTLYGTLTLYRNGVDVTSENGLNKTLGVEYYNYTAYSSGNENYSSKTLSLFLNVTRTGTLTILYLNNTRANISTFAGNIIAVNSSVNSNEGNINVYINGTLIYSGVSPSYNLTNFSIPGMINVTVIFYQTQNYSYSSETWYANVSEPPEKIPPVITIISPLNTTYGINSFFLNYSINDSSPISSCKYSLNGLANQTLINCGTASISGLVDGSYEIKVYANDSLGNLNYSSVTFSIDSSPPLYSNLAKNTPATYAQNYSYFNLTWNDGNLQTVLFESNFSGNVQNYSMQSLGNNRYSFSQILPAGTFYWKSYANDSFGHLNNTSSEIFTVQKSSQGINLYLNGNQGNLTLTYGTIINVSAQSVDNDAQLYRNSVLISNPEIAVLGAGYYNYTAIFNGNENYSAKTITYFLNVSKASPTLQLILNGFNSDISVNAFSNLEINASSVAPDGFDVSLYEDGALILSGTNLSFNKNYSAIGQHVWNASINESENYTSGSLNYIASVLDANSPQFFNLKTSYNSPTTYIAGKNYQFNSTWTDDIGIEEVIFEFSGINYSYLDSGIQKNGDEYFITLPDLGVGIYQYRWHVNDTSGNLVSTPLRSYTINQAITALFLSMSPGSSISYRTSMNINCMANNPESVPVMTRNFDSISIPDTSTLKVGNYSYACTSSSTENYTSASATATLTINKAQPIINVTLNEEYSNLTLPISGGEVNISASLIEPEFGELNLTIGNIFVQSNLNSIFNTTLFSNSGTYKIKLSFAGNENYSDGSEIRYVVILGPAPTGGGGSGGGGGGSGGGSGQSQSQNITKTISLEFINLEDVLISPGESKIIQLTMKNTGNTFLNKCKINVNDKYKDWVESTDTKNINSGEITDYIINIRAPLEAEKSSDFNMKVECLEKTISIPLGVVVLQSGMHIEVNDMSLIDKKKLEVNYTIQGNSEFNQNLLFRVFNDNEELISEKSENVDIANEKNKKTILLDVSKAEKGLLKIAISKGDGIPIVEEFFVFDSKSGVTGFAFIDNANSIATLSILLIIIFLIISYFMLKRIMILKKWGKGYYSSEEPRKESVHIQSRKFNLNEEINKNNISIEKKIDGRNDLSWETY